MMSHMMSVLKITEELWQRIAPLLPPKPPRPKGGRPPLPDRQVLAGIMFVLLTGCPWRHLPAKALGCGSPTTCWRRVRDWQHAGVWERLHHELLVELRRVGKLDVSRASLDAISVRAKRGANSPDPTRLIGASQGPSTSC
jgi:transposase